jgi:hypothetical protein
LQVSARAALPVLLTYKGATSSVLEVRAFGDHSLVKSIRSLSVE